MAAKEDRGDSGLQGPSWKSMEMRALMNFEVIIR